MTLLPIRRRYRPDGSIVFYCVYTCDVGNLHVIDYYLWREAQHLPHYARVGIPHWYFSPADWSRE